MTRHENDVLAFRVYAGCSGRALADAERWRDLALRASDTEVAVAFMGMREGRLNSARENHDLAVHWAAKARASAPPGGSMTRAWAGLLLGLDLGLISGLLAIWATPGLTLGQSVGVIGIGLALGGTLGGAWGRLAQSVES